ncbi:MAG: PAS domain-containing protein [Cytophagaceae bacterium]
MKPESLSFTHLKPFIRFILENHLDDFVNSDLKRAKEVNLPMLKLFSGMSEEELFQFSKMKTKELFDNILGDKIVKAILETNNNWKLDKIPGIPRDKVFASDIALVYNIKKHSFLSLVFKYTSDGDLIVKILKEIEDFYTFQESLAISTFKEINQEEIAKREQHLKEAQAISHTGSWEYHLPTNKVTWSDELYRIFGYSPGEIEINFELYSNHLHPDDKEMVLNTIQESIQTGKPYTFIQRIIKKDGSIRYLKGSGNVNQKNGDQIISLAGVALDITDAKLAEDKIIKSEALLLETQEIGNIGSYEWNIKEDNSYISPQTARIFGYEYSPKDNFKEFMERVHPDDREKVENDLYESFQTGKPFASEYRIFRKDDNQLRYVWAKGKISFDRDNKPERLLGSIIDITERKLIEENLKQKQALLEASNKELEAFCYTISHDLRSPLRAIDGFGRKLSSNYEHQMDSEGKRLLGIVRNNAQKMGNMIDSLLEFSRLNRKEISKKNINTSEVVMQVIAACNEQHPENKASIVVSDLLNVPGDKDLLYQVWQNLISNAIKFTSKTVNPKIEIGCRQEFGTVIYFVKDNGAGFEMEYKDKLFGVFQRLHSSEEFSGTGVGLATVQRIIHRHGGSVWAEGQPDKGATFYFSLPVQKMVKQKAVSLNSQY